MILSILFPYIKKEDAFKTVGRRKYMFVFLTLTVVVFAIIFSSLLSTSTTKLYQALDRPTPLLTLLAPTIATIGIIIMTIITSYAFFSPNYSNDYLKKLEKYKEGEMINQGELITNYQKIYISLYFITMFAIMISYMLPILLAIYS